jgi:hypothetical protein
MWSVEFVTRTTRIDRIREAPMLRIAIVPPPSILQEPQDQLNCVVIVSNNNIYIYIHELRLFSSSVDLLYLLPERKFPLKWLMIEA